MANVSSFLHHQRGHSDKIKYKSTERTIDSTDSKSVVHFSQQQYHWFLPWLVAGGATLQSIEKQMLNVIHKQTIGTLNVTASTLVKVLNR